MRRREVRELGEPVCPVLWGIGEMGSFFMIKSVGKWRKIMYNKRQF